MNIRNVFLNKKALVSLSVVAIVAVIVIGGTMAYFNDTETSTGNKFTAGKFNLLVGSECTYNGVSQAPCNWVKKDLASELFFNFDDIKPGDSGENTITLKVDNNDAWICAELANLVGDDNGCDSPENKVDNTCGAGQGELQDNLYFTIWKDNGAGANACNNILDADETAIVSDQSAENLLWPIADSEHGPAITGDTDYCVGVAWNVPIATSNIIQTDSLVGDVKFTAVQARNMNNFKCSDLYTEICGDQKDNDYDGQIDEGCAEICDGIDNNGNGQIDEGFTNTDGDAQMDCIDPDDDNDGVTDFGDNCSLIANPDQRDSDSDAIGDACDECVPATEVCDGIDNDCDGSTDETFPQQQQNPCYCNIPPPGGSYPSIYQCVNGVVSCICPN
ncbi:MAG: SipW-dependent-type signal peptide-containing protein [Patescibacteria group bacterium]